MITHADVTRAFVEIRKFFPSFQHDQEAWYERLSKVNRTGEQLLRVVNDYIGSEKSAPSYAQIYKALQAMPEQKREVPQEERTYFKEQLEKDLVPVRKWRNDETTTYANGYVKWMSKSDVVNVFGVNVYYVDFLTDVLDWESPGKTTALLRDGDAGPIKVSDLLKDAKKAKDRMELLLEMALSDVRSDRTKWEPRLTAKYSLAAPQNVRHVDFTHERRYGS